MKTFNFSHWSLFPSNKALLFFAQTLEEMLFHYGHDSLKVPALNFHFLCVEISNTIEKINEGICDRANMKPLFEELKKSFQSDPIVQKMFDDNFDSLFFVKNAEGEFIRSCSDITKKPTDEVAIKRIGQVVNYLLSEMHRNSRYYKEIKECISDVIKAPSFGFEEQEKLYELCRILLAELINTAYSQEYIYWVVNDVFYNHQKPVNNIDDTLELFWSSFDFEEKSYTVTLPIRTDSLLRHLKHFRNINMEENTQGLFGNSCKWVAVTKLKAMDQYIAHKYAITLISFYTALLQYNNHRSESYTADKAVVILDDKNETFYIESPLTPIKRGNVLSDEKNNEKIASIINNGNFDPNKLVNVIELHASALNSNDISNQLINLWTIIEVLVPIEQENNYSKINQICNTLTTILNCQYVYSLISQLYLDLHKCIPKVIRKTLRNVSGNNCVEKLLAVLVLPQYHSLYEQIFDELGFYPTMQYRIERYTLLFANRHKLKELLLSHQKRLSWHIMRIYRNRNMIVHDGSYFPYIDILVQNLHYYVDTLINTINLYTGKGYSSIMTIYKALQQKEYQYQMELEKTNSDGSPQEIDDNYLTVILGDII